MLKRAPSLLTLMVLSLCLVSSVLAQAPQPDRDIIPGEVIVGFHSKQDTLSARQALNDNRLKVLKTSQYSNEVLIQVELGQEAAKIAELAARDDIAFATYNYRIYALDGPNDPGYGNQWGLNNVGQAGGIVDADIDAPEAWQIHTGANNITVAVIDSGVDLDHPDLLANLVAGYDFIGNIALPDDTNSHGTHVAGITAAIGNNGQGITGVSWGAKIMPLKVLDTSGNGNTFDLAEAIYYAADHGAKIINMSLGANCPTPWTNVEAAVNYARAKGVLLIAASGNSNGPVFCPALIQGVMAVGATDSFDGRWQWNSLQGSNYGSALDVSAPGASIFSTVPNASYGYKTGTSMASPHVAGLAALIWSFAPSLTNNQVANILLSTSDDLGPPGQDPFFGHGRINARRALEVLGVETSDQMTLLVDDQTTTATNLLQLSTLNSDLLSWSATISPAVPWLTLTSPDSGSLSAAAPVWLSLQATQPDAYGTYTTSIVISGTTSSSALLETQITEVKLVYVSQIQRVYLPLIYK